MALAVLDGIITFVHSTSAAVVAAHPAAILGVDGALPLGVVLGLGPHGEQGLEILGILFASDAKVLRVGWRTHLRLFTPHRMSLRLLRPQEEPGRAAKTNMSCGRRHVHLGGPTQICDHPCAARGWIVRRRDGIKPSNMLLARRGGNMKHAAWTVCVEASAVAKHARHN